MFPNGQVQFPQIPFALHPRQVQQSSHPEPKNPPNLPDSSFLKAFKTLHTTEIQSGLYMISTKSGSLFYPFSLGFNYSLITGQGVGVGVEWREAGDLETHMRHFKTCPFLGLPVFQPGGPEGPRRKSLTGIKANGDERRAEKPDRGRRFACDPLLRNVKRRWRHCGQGARKGEGPQPASLRSEGTPGH